jgi:type III secretion system FlhB-like substrate exporter
MSPDTENKIIRMKREETLEIFELFTDSLDRLEKAEPIPEDIYNMTANTVRALREYLNR